MLAHSARLILVLVGLVLASCKHRADADVRVGPKNPKSAAGALGKPLPKDGTLQGHTFRYRFAIYLRAAPKLDLNRELATAVTGTGLGLVAKKPELERPRWISRMN